MRTAMKCLLLVLTLMVYSQRMSAQEMVVIMSQNYTYDDPRWNNPATLEKGEVITVYKEGDTYQYFGSYTAASVGIPKHVFHIPGSVRGERCIVINGTHVRLRKGPSTKTGIFCYDANNGSSVARYDFKVKPGKETDADGIKYEWTPFYLDKGTRLPYLGKAGNFYKTSFNGYTFYISAQYTYVK